MNGTPENKVLTPQKPVNLLPEVPSQTSRKLSDREQHDCDVIGKCGVANFIFIISINSLQHSISFVNGLGKLIKSALTYKFGLDFEWNNT